MYKIKMNKAIKHNSVTQGFLLVLLICTTQIVLSRDVMLSCPPLPAQCQYDASVFDEHFYYVEGSKFKIDYKEGYLWFQCPDGVGLESQAMPRFDRAVRVQKVKLTGCATPAAPYARVLASLNVTALHKLIIVRPRGDFRSFHFTGLNVSVLEVTATKPVGLEAGALEELAALADLRLERVALANADLLRLPPALVRLDIALSNITEFPTPALRRLSSIKHLILQETTLTVGLDLSVAPSLQFVSFFAPLNGLPSSSSIKNITSHDSRSLEIRGDCGSLSRLDVRGAAGPLPVAWLSRCSALTELSLSYMRLDALPGDMLHAVPRLRRLAVSECGLRDLPADLLAQARNLEVLDLSGNKLETLPEGLLVSVQALLELNLSGNRLSRSGARPALAASSLRTLALNDNPLGDLCDRGSDTELLRDGVSEVREMRALQSLRLARTGATRLCADWRRDLRALRDLDLRHNNISRLEAGDLQWSRNLATTVQLRGNPLRSVTLAQDEYRRALEMPLSALVTFSMDATLECDCRLYWAVRLVHERPYVPIHDAACEDGRKLLTASPDDLVCDLSRDECAPHCVCRLHGTRLRMDCSGAGLVSPPRPPPGTPPASVLLLANNSISTLGPADFGPELRLVDLSGNSIRDMDAETAASLLAPPRTVLLARNELACHCGAALPAALLAHSSQVQDYRELRCADGRRVAELQLDLCLPRALLATLCAAGGVLLLTAVAVVACLVRHPARRRIKRFLFDRGLCLRWLLRETDEADDRPYKYDVFVSFSHHDEKFVTEWLVPGLEAGPRPYRLCLHYRDWTPGEWIPTQITESVRESRRTLLVVSSHWARSTWARAEFRAAYERAQADGGPRLVSLVLEDPAALRDLDPEMRDFLDSNTYLRHDDPWFWQKLRHALPRGKCARLPANVGSPESIAPSPGAGGRTDTSAGPAAREDVSLHTAPVA